ncbi:SAM-dependent chlorinase/fluorinase [soil metagenome]
MPAGADQGLLATASAFGSAGSLLGVAVPISFLSDFGRIDEFVGVVHGVIARIAPEVRVIDVGHDFPRGEVRIAALALLRAIQYLPRGVALAVVDPGVGTERRPIAVRTEWGHFVGPDNGLLAPAVAMVGGADRIVSIDNPELRIPSAGATFQGRDLFAPSAAVLASGEAAIDDLGPEIVDGSFMPLMVPLAERLEDGVLGEVLWVDHFGNVSTNLGPDDLVDLGLKPGDDVSVAVGVTEHRVPWAAAYGDVDPGKLLLHVDSSGQVAVAVRGGRADERLGVGHHVSVTFRRPRGGNRITVQGVSPAV